MPGEKIEQSVAELIMELSKDVTRTARQLELA